MKALVKETRGPGLILKEVPRPRPGPEEVVVEVEATSICGTDVSIYKWKGWVEERIRNLPLILGHEFAGKVVEVGERVKNFEPGDYVSAESHIFCGRCYYCMWGSPHVCKNLKIIGVDVDGSFAEYVRVHEKVLWRNAKSLPPELASIQEPLGNAVDTVLAEDVAGKTVLILGCGPIGLMAIAVARMSGASKIFATEISEYRIKLARRMGADLVLNPREVDVVQEVLLQMEDGVDVLLEMSGSPSALEQGLKVLRSGGRVSILGLFPPKVELNLNEDVILKGVRIYGITGRRIFETWFKVSRFLERGLDLTPLITHKFPLGGFEEGMELMSSGNGGKIVLIP